MRFDLVLVQYGHLSTHTHTMVPILFKHIFTTPLAGA